MMSNAKCERSRLRYSVSQASETDTRISIWEVAAAAAEKMRNRQQLNVERGEINEGYEQNP